MLIVGGGLAGAALAYYLAKEGVEAALIERGELNREASGTNAGSFHFQIALHQLTSWDASDARDRLLGEVRLLVEAARACGRRSSRSSAPRWTCTSPAA